MQHRRAAAALSSRRPIPLARTPKTHSAVFCRKTAPRPPFPNKTFTSVHENIFPVSFFYVRSESLCLLGAWHTGVVGAHTVPPPPPPILTNLLQSMFPVSLAPCPITNAAFAFALPLLIVLRIKGKADFLILRAFARPHSPPSLIESLKREFYYPHDRRGKKGEDGGRGEGAFCGAAAPSPSSRHCGRDLQGDPPTHIVCGRLGWSVVEKPTVFKGALFHQ